MKKTLTWISSILIVQTAYALSDYRCTDKSLCDLREYTEASSFDEAFSKGKLTAQIRLAYIDQNNHEEGVSDTYATSIGGQLKYETAKFYHISLAASAFVSQKVSVLTGDGDELNPDFFDDEGDSFAYLGEAYIDYEYEHLSLRYGRQTLDTPLNNRDDIRMLPNTFEAFMAGYGGIDNFIFVAGYVTSWAGYDSGGDISKFKDIPGTIATTGEKGDGVFLAGVMNDSLDNVIFQTWYYDFDKLSGVIYIDGIYGNEYENGLNVETGVQYGNYSEKSSSQIDGHVFGGILNLGYNEMSLGFAFNHVDTSENNTIILGHGGGPYFTSMEEMTIDAVNDANAYVISAGIDFSKILVNGLSLDYAYGHFDGNDVGADVEYVENDIIVSYAISDKADFEASYAYVNDRKNSGTNDTGYDRLLVRVNYNF